jgi:hypothetical protein
MGMLISGIFANEHVDSSGEILSVEGIDISDLEKGKGTANFEHNNDDADDVVGRILYAKKIFSEKDCENEDQLKFWKISKIPYLYGIIELFDTEGHPGAIAIASMMNYSKRKNEPMMVGFSIEGSTLERDGMHLKRAVARRCALTIKPCNKSCISDILEEIPEAKKAMGADEFHPLHKAIQTDFVEYQDHTDFNELVTHLVSFSNLSKTLTAGMPTATPGNNVQGAALQKPSDVKTLKYATYKSEMDKDLKKRILEKVRDNWDRVQPIEDFLKQELPELGEKFKDHFAELMSEIKLTKSRISGDTVNFRHTLAHLPHSKEQRMLIAGIRANPKDSSDPHRTKNSMDFKVIIHRGFNSEDDPMFSSERAVIYYNLAKNYFELGEYVPVTSAYLNPTDRHIHHACLFIPKLISGTHQKYIQHYDTAIKHIANTPILQKLAVMDYILGNNNRHIENLMIDPIHMKPYFVGNHHAFNSPETPEYWHLLPDPDLTIMQETRNWVSDLDEQILALHLRNNAVPKSKSAEVLARLAKVKDLVISKANILDIYGE